MSFRFGIFQPLQPLALVFGLNGALLAQVGRAVLLVHVGKGEVVVAVVDEIAFERRLRQFL